VAATAGALVATVVVAAGCRQLVGIGERSEVDAGAVVAACGLSLPAGDCNACIQSACCAESTACNGVPSCKSLEECYAPCAGDPACITACRDQYPEGTVLESSRIEACVATHCPVDCATNCGLRPLDRGPDGGAACQACTAAQACTQARACAQSVACQSMLTCNVNCATLDCVEACIQADDAGAAAFLDLANALKVCASACNGGQDWSCVGHVSWPGPSTESNTLSLQVLDPSNNKPVPGAHVALCQRTQETCLSPVTTGTTDDAGVVVLSYQSQLNFGGMDGYAEITGTGITPTLFFWDFPLSVQNAFIPDVYALSASLIALDPPLPGHGHLGVALFDCDHTGADAVTIALSSTDANTQILYHVTQTGALSADAGSTDTSGILFVTNVPAGQVAMTVTTLTGITVSTVSFLVRDGWVDQILAVPTPQQ
jgi:hypothetical protein